MELVNNTRFGMECELKAKRMLKRHFTYLRKQNHLSPFDYTGIDKLTGERIAIEIKAIRRETGKLVHIESPAFERKLKYLHTTNRKGIILVIIKNGITSYHLARLSQHISKGMLIEIK